MLALSRGRMQGMERRRQVAVVGAGRADAETAALAEALGGELARLGAVTCCGGLGGVMEAACRGARAAGGSTLGLLPGGEHAAANAHCELVVPTGLGEGRNLLVVRAGEAVVALSGGPGTLSEVALALKIGRPIVGLRAWAQVEGVRVVEEPLEAARLAVELASG